MGPLQYPEPPSLTSNNINTRSWAEPATEAAQCLASMSSSTTTTGTTASAAASNHPASHPEGDAPAESDGETAAAAVTAAPRAPRSKPARLSLACNPCRKRKVRCDARQPKCHNCTVRRDVCITSDPRRPGAPVATRRRATQRHTGPARADHARLAEEQTLVDEQLVDESAPRLPSPPVSVAVLPSEPPRQPASNHLRSASLADIPISRPEILPDTHYQSSEQPHAREVPRDPGSVRTQASNASSTKRASTTNQSQNRERSENITWLSRAYQEISVEQGRKGTDLDQQDATAVTPDVVVNTDGAPHRSKVCSNYHFPGVPIIASTTLLPLEIIC